MREFIKFIVKGFFGWFGLDVISKNRVVIPPVNTLLHNTDKGHDEYWSNPANKEFWDGPHTHKFYENIIKIVKQFSIDLNNKTIADIGCGNGNLLRYINQYFSPGECYGYEYSNEALKLAREFFPQGNYFIHDINNPIDRKFDFVFCTEVIEHILKPEIAFSNIIDTIDHQGGAIITVPEGRRDTSMKHINFWSPESWQMFCKKILPNGFTCHHQLIDNLQCAVILRENNRQV